VSEETVREITGQILRALNYLHGTNLVHRDLKTENVMVEDTNSDEINVKLIDFGFAKVTADNEPLMEFVGTPYFVAPEIVARKPYNSKCDIWSLGVLVYNMMSSGFPFDGNDQYELFGKIQKGEFSFEEQLWDFFSQ